MLETTRDRKMRTDVIGTFLKERDPFNEKIGKVFFVITYLINH